MYTEIDGTMGANPFRDCIDRVMRAYSGNLSGPTLDVMRRRYNVMEREVTSLYTQGRISTLSPSELTSGDIEAIYGHYRSKQGMEGQIKQSSIRKDMVNLRRLCLFEGNRCVDEFKVKFPGYSLSDGHERLPVFTRSQVLRIFAVSPEKLDDTNLIRSYGLLALYFGAGLRTVELMNAKASNIRMDGDGASIRLDVVKGSGTYGKPREALIIPQMLPLLRRYLEWRDGYLDNIGKDCQYYFFPMGAGGMASDNTIRTARAYAEKDLGISYDGRMCRRSYGQYMKDKGVSIEAISVLMGHSTTETTETYYARMTPSMAIDDAMGAIGGRQ